AIIKDYKTQKVLRPGIMYEDALRMTERTSQVTVYNRSKKRLWTKEAESGNDLKLKQNLTDCDNDSLLIRAEALGSVWHTGADTCWSEKNHTDNFLLYLEEIIALRRNSQDENSYVYKLFNKGLNKIAQKVGEEAVELIIEAKD